MGKRSLAILLAALFVTFPAAYGRADVQPAVGTWLISDRLAIQVFDCQRLLCGRIVWLRQPTLRTPKLCGRTIVWGLTPTGPAHWNNGTFFDPEDGETYNLTATLQPDGSMSARIYEGIALFGKTELLRRISPRSLTGWC